MTTARRTDIASRLIKATPEAIYRAMLDPTALAQWLPPEGMVGRFDRFEPREGGVYRMTLTYLVPHEDTPGKSAADEDTVSGRYVELVPNEKIVQAASFDSDDPELAGEMVMTCSLKPASGGTIVDIVCENVPSAIRKEDHDEGLASSLANLAAYVE